MSSNLSNQISASEAAVRARLLAAINGGESKLKTWLRANLAHTAIAGFAVGFPAGAILAHVFKF